MFGITAVAASVGLLSSVLTAGPPPTGVCLPAAVHPAFAPAWCAKSAPAGFDDFRRAFADYQAATEDAFQSEYQVSKELPYTCWDSAGFHPANAAEVDLITVPLDQSVAPALDRAAQARNRMLAAQAKAFAGNPDAVGLSVDVEMLSKVIEALGRGKITLASAGEIYRTAQSEETCLSAGAEISSWGPEYVSASALQGTLVRAITSVLTKTQETCSGVRVVDPLSPKAIKRKSGASSVRTDRAGGASLLAPATLDIGKKPVKLPLTIKNPPSGYMTIQVNRGGKGIVATGGDAQGSPFGVLMTVPGKTPDGMMTVTIQGDFGIAKTRLRVR